MKTDLQKIFDSQQEPGAAWLQDFRQNALQSFQQQGLPTSKQEDWKYTSVKTLAQTDFALCKGPVRLPDSQELSLLKEEAYRLVFVGGHFQPELSQIKDLPQGVELSPLSQALKDHGALLKDSLGKSLGSLGRPFVALNEAFLGEGLFLKIAKNVVLKKPIEFVHIATSNGQASMSHPRVWVDLEENSQANFIEYYASGQGINPSWTNSVTEFFLEPGSVLKHLRLQEESSQNFFLNSTGVQVATDAQLHSYSFDLGAQLNRQEYYVALNDPGAHVSLKGLYLAQDREHTDFQTLIHHRKPHGTSEEIFKGVLADQAHGVFNGQIVVEPHAQKTASALTNKNLMLSKEAAMDTKPLLKIFADDVKCSHGATIGRLDPNQLFYLKSRGLPEDLAKHLLTYAFAAEVVEGLPEEKFKNPLKMRIKEHLNVEDVTL